MKRSFRNALAFALLCTVSGTIYAPLGVGAAGATANAEAKTRAERLEQERRAASADAYMAHLHLMAVGTAGGLLPNRPFPLGMENYVGVDANASFGRADANTNARGGATSTR